LLDGDGWSPIFVFVQETQTNSARGVHVGVEQWGHKLDLWRRRREVLLENHVAFVEAALPRRRLLAGDGKLPLHEVGCAVWVLHGSGDEAEGVVLPPLFPLLGQSCLSDSGHRESSSSPRSN